MKKILVRALVIALALVVISFIGGAGNYLITWLLPPRVFILIGVVVILILLKILFTLKGRE